MAIKPVTVAKNEKWVTLSDSEADKYIYRPDGLLYAIERWALDAEGVGYPEALRTKKVFNYGPSKQLTGIDVYNYGSGVYKGVVLTVDRFDSKNNLIGRDVILHNDRYQAYEIDRTTYNSSAVKTQLERWASDQNGNATYILDRTKYDAATGSKVIQRDTWDARGQMHSATYNYSGQMTDESIFDTSGKRIEIDRYKYSSSSGKLIEIDKYDGSLKLIGVDNFNTTGQLINAMATISSNNSPSMSQTSLSNSPLTLTQSLLCAVH